jgi:hypothetical protein
VRRSGQIICKLFGIFCALPRFALLFEFCKRLTVTVMIAVASNPPDSGKSCCRKDTVMLSRIRAIRIALLLAAGCALCGAPLLAATPFAITATNVTMASSGEVTTSSSGDTSIAMGASQFTVTGLQGSGSVTISCQYSGAVTTAKIPQECGITGPGTLPVPTGETTLSGTVYFVPYGQVVPSLAEVGNAPRLFSPLPATGLVLAGALMLGFGLRRRAQRWLAQVVIAVGALTAAVGFSGCSLGQISMTPGTYQYTISATYGADPVTPLEQMASTNITLTIQ